MSAGGAYAGMKAIRTKPSPEPLGPCRSKNPHCFKIFLPEGSAEEVTRDPKTRLETQNSTAIF